MDVWAFLSTREAARFMEAMDNLLASIQQLTNATQQATVIIAQQAASAAQMASTIASLQSQVAQLSTGQTPSPELVVSLQDASNQIAADANQLVSSIQAATPSSLGVPSDTTSGSVPPAIPPDVGPVSGTDSGTVPSIGDAGTSGQP